MKIFRDNSPAIIYVLHSGNLYGTERMAIATLEGLSDYKRRILFAPEPAGTDSVFDVATQAGFETRKFQNKLQLVKGLLGVFLRHRVIDVIGVGVATHFICHVFGRLLRSEVRQLQVAHGGAADHDAYGRKRPLNKIPVGIIAVSEFVRQKLVQHGVCEDRISVIDNFLSRQQQFDYPKRPPYTGMGCRPIDPDRIKVAIVSRVDGIKRIDLLVEAIEKYRLPQFEFHVYGTGEHLNSLQERAAALPNIRFHGYVGDVKERLADADLLLHLCPEEPFGLVIVEAFLSRLVVIVPDSGGAGSLVKPGVTGLRFLANDVADMSRTLQAVRNMAPEQLQRLADAGAATLDDQFSQFRGIRRYREALDAAGNAAGLATRSR